jgi:DNA-binding response OmpR family regulator
MRPKKVILLVLANEQDLSTTSYILDINGFRVLPAANAEQAIGLFVKTAVDLVLADFALEPMDGDALVKQLKKLAGHVPMILLGDLETMSGRLHQADAMLAKKSVSTVELLKRIKVMSAGKRGPRKGLYRRVAGKLTLKDTEVSYG